MQRSHQRVNTRTGHVVVIGGGIAGLAAAHRLVLAGLRVTLLEATERLGGKLMTGEIAGTRVDLGAESMLARRPEAVGLARAVGLGDRLQPPATATASVWTRDALRPMPKGHVMGVPGDPAALGGVLSPEGLARIAQERDLTPTAVGDDVAVGSYVADRLGREVVDRLVEPLLGGVYAGDAYRISMRAAVPQLFEVVKEGGSLLDGVRRIQERAAARQQTGPVFQGIDGGVGTLPDAVAAAVRAGGGEILTATPVLGLTRGDEGWNVRTDTRVITADGIVLATPAWSASTLLAAESPAASAELAGVEYASMALITLAFRRSDIGEASALHGRSGFLVPPVDGRTIKASTFSSNKWQWVADAAPGLFVLRTSVGRYGEEDHLHREDEELIDVSLSDLAEATGLAAKPLDTEVTRWIGGLPQYPVGHLDRVARIRDEVAKLPGLRVCGAVYDGVGIPACVASAHRAAYELAHDLTGEGTGEGTAAVTGTVTDGSAGEDAGGDHGRDHRHVDPGSGHSERGGTIAV
ncbi:MULTISPECIES: protoporphyrinogen oxidase [unclassified Streptomyces]|uniref:protoporphyrinogen oxidase n=1 Tax=Streptomyces sp. NPDC055082 TaxID=3365718 RepID=UPI0037D3D4DD